MGNEVYSTLSDCRSCATKGTWHRVQKEERFVCRVCWNSLQWKYLVPWLRQIPEVNVYFSFLTGTRDLHKRLWSRKVTSTFPASVFIGNWVISYWAAMHLLTDNRPIFSFIKAVHEYLHVLHLTTIIYLSQTNGWVEWLDNRIVPSVHHYWARHQTDWDPLVQRLT